LARSNQDLEQFAYVASHDLQEPLRMVATYTQLLAERYRGKLDDDADKYIHYAVDGALRMQTLVQDLLAFSRLGRQGTDLQSTDCNVVVETAVKNLQTAVHESGAQVTHDHLPAVVTDGAQLPQVFQNLIGNAIKFRGSDPPAIRISASKKGREWVFAVADNGIGIAPEHAEIIFVIFKRLHTRAEYPGSGIGLAICKRIIERQGGKIWVESQRGQGATFKFTLPVAAPRGKYAHTDEHGA
jgi:light-regulated signal transduction histidine kinase (bacteriophytochrome)